MNPSYDNPSSFGSGGASASVPISSGAGDIILAPEKKSYKKPIIIVMIIIALIISGIVVAFSLMPSGGGLNVSSDAKIAFNKYANYLLYGEDSDRPLEGEYDDSRIYEFDEMRSEDVKNMASYLKKVNSLWNSLGSLVGNYGDDDLKKLVDNYSGNIELINFTFDSEIINEEELIKEVLNHNLEETKAWIVSKYDDMIKSNYDVVKRFGEAEINYYQLYAEYLEKLKSFGCLNEEGILFCEDFSDEALESQIEDAYDAVNEITQGANYGVLKDCWEISKYINGGSQ